MHSTSSTGRRSRVPPAPPSGPVARATVLALEGQAVQATLLFREGMRGSRAVGDIFGSALAGLSMLRMLGASVPEARTAGEEALRVFERGGAKPFAAMTRELLAADPAGARGMQRPRNRPL